MTAFGLGANDGRDEGMGGGTEARDDGGGDDDGGASTAGRTDAGDATRLAARSAMSASDARTCPGRLATVSASSRPLGAAFEAGFGACTTAAGFRAVGLTATAPSASVAVTASGSRVAGFMDATLARCAPGSALADGRGGASVGPFPPVELFSPARIESYG
jgi:hypothetical protein